MKKLSTVSLSAFLSAVLLSSSLVPIDAHAYSIWPSSVDDKTLPSLAPMLEKSTPAVVSIAVKGTHEIKSNIPEIFRFFW